MPVIISLLRGVNLGGNRPVKMENLRRLYESLGFTHVETFINSGNVVCRAPARGLASLPKRIDQAMEETFGFPGNVVLRSAAELRQVIAANPFAGRDINPANLLINFLAADPGPECCAAVRVLSVAPDELHLDGRHLYIYYPNGQARAALPWTRIQKTLGTSCTGRNLTTVQKLLAMAERQEASQ